MNHWPTATMFDAASYWGAFTLANVALKATCLLIAAFVATALLSRRGATHRHFAWVSAFALLAALPLLSLGLPAWHVLPGWLRLADAESLADADTTASSVASSKEYQNIDPLPEVPTSAGQAASSDIAEASPTGRSASVAVTDAKDAAAKTAYAPVAVSSRVPSASQTWFGPSVRMGIVVVWCAGCLVALVRLLLSARLLRRVRSRAVETLDGPLFEEFERLRGKLGLTRPVRLLIAEESAMPMVWGIRHSCVLVPQDIENWPASQRRTILLHELGHVVRFDPLSQLLVEFTRALYWFHPLVWLAARRAHVERERACDDLVLNRGVCAADYARHLLDLVSGGRLRRIGPALGVAMASTSRLEGRVRSILDQKRDRRPLTGWTVTAGTFLALSVGLPLAMLQAADAEAPKPDAPVAAGTPTSNSNDGKQPPTANSTRAPDVKPEPKEADPKIPTHPISISGRALDTDGKPIAEARIFLASQNADWKRLAETRSDEEGRYAFKDVGLPIKRARNNDAHDVGAFEVFGLAEGYAFAWRPKKWYYPEPRHINWYDDGDPDRDWPLHFSGDEKIELDLTFRKPTSLKGRIVNDLGQPIPNTEVDIRYCDPKWNKEDFHSTQFIGAFHSLNERNIIPREEKVAMTDEEGRFELAGLPPDCRFDLWIRPPGYPLRRIKAVTHPGVTQDGEGHRVYSGQIDLTFDRPVDVPFQILFDDTGQPAPKIYVGANSAAGSKSGGTDENGNATLALSPGKYLIEVMPRTGSDYLVTETEIDVDRMPLEKPHVIRLRAAAVVEVTVVDAESGRGIPDVDFWREETFIDKSGKVHRQPMLYMFRSLDIDTRISHVHRPRTDASGHLKALFEPGGHKVGVALHAFPAAYEVVEADGQNVDCKAGKTIKLTFHMRRKETFPEKNAAIE